jgi:hypothetical protein
MQIKLTNAAMLKLEKEDVTVSLKVRLGKMIRLNLLSTEVTA